MSLVFPDPEQEHVAKSAQKLLEPSHFIAHFSLIASCQSCQPSLALSGVISIDTAMRRKQCKGMSLLYPNHTDIASLFWPQK